jgi:hypothetical protein
MPKGDQFRCLRLLINPVALPNRHNNCLHIVKEIFKLRHYLLYTLLDGNQRSL